MRIAVTGATGFVGGAIVERLATAGHEVVGLGRQARPPGYGHRYVAWDLAGGEPAPAVLAESDAVVHAAANVSPWGPDGPFIATTVDGTDRVLGGLSPETRLVVIGSASVYDPRLPHLGAREPEAPVSPDRYLNAYGRAKAAQERLVSGARPDAIVLRPRAIWGPGDRTLLPRILRRIRAGGLPIPGGGRSAVSATHISSVVSAVEAALARPTVHGPVNVADATPTTSAALLRTVAAALGIPLWIVPVPVGLAWGAGAVAEAVWTVARLPGEPPVSRYAVAALGRPFTLDLTRLHSELGVRPDIDVEAAARNLALPAAPVG
jgi:nucleoside-diphosphate-sugar epimerase